MKGRNLGPQTQRISQQPDIVTHTYSSSSILIQMKRALPISVLNQMTMAQGQSFPTFISNLKQPYNNLGNIRQLQNELENFNIDINKSWPMNVTLHLDAFTVFKTRSNKAKRSADK